MRSPEAVAARWNLPLVATIIGDIGDRRLEAVLVELTRDADVAVARAAHDALRALEINASRHRG